MLSFERMLGTFAGFGEIAVRSFDQWMFVAVGKLAGHGVVSSLFAFVGFERALVAVGIVFEMITAAIWHEKPLAQFAGDLGSVFTTTFTRLHVNLKVGKYGL
jgi:hypothetical protein